VRRAADGERIVITRYGRPAALLTELEPSYPNAPGPQRLEWEREREAFMRLTSRRSKRLRGKYVAVSGGKVVGTDVDHERLYHRVFRKMGGHVFFIGRVGAPMPVVEMPGFELE
jgi:antitoxin (DNA-binding transcriptional repressor) of toxin-antitoxin stability system